MEVARDNDLGIEGTCGGSISCCTCHVIIDKDWFSIVGGPNPDEEDMLDLALGLKPTSRLGCQIEITDELEHQVDVFFREQFHIDQKTLDW